MYSCNQISLTQTLSKLFYLQINTTNFTNFRIKNSRVQMTNFCFVVDMMMYIFWLHMILSSHPNNLPVGKTGQCSRFDFSLNCIVYKYLKCDYRGGGGGPLNPPLHPISKMSQMLITSSAAIRSSSSNDRMSGISNIFMFRKPVVAPIYSGL